jgi:cephalosporin-C deacetylase-like acetyl esterase
MKLLFAPLFAAALTASPVLAQNTPAPAAPSYPRPLVELNTSYFPFHDIGPITPETWAARKREIRERVLLAAGLFPLPTKTPLNAVVHGRVERDDYTIDRVFFESFPGHYVTGSLYLPKKRPANGKMPGILSAHGHWPKARDQDNGPDSAVTKQALAIGAERWESGARAPLHARCVQLARMGCAVFFYDMLGYGDSLQIAQHRSGRRPELNGQEPGTFGLFAAAADLRLQTSFGLQTWNSLRALDFLLTVAGVDPERIAMTGESGGATQTLALAAIDDRIAASFPAVMVSTAMQGGCTCENAPYLRLNQGNIDLAAAFAPKPLGLTAANDWTKELEKKGWPELKNVWAKLGKPDHVTATFNVHWAHNFNHVSRTTLYGFINKHFKLGFSEPVLEREFVVSPPSEVTVWTDAHPKPTGDKVGGAHEQALLKYWSDDSDRVIAGRPEIIARAWEIMIGRTLPAKTDLRLERTDRSARDGYTVESGTVTDTRHNTTVPWTFVRPNGDRWNNTIALWLTNRGIEGLTDGNGPNAAAKQLLDAGFAIAVPTLYLPQAKEQPMNVPKNNDPQRHAWQWASSYTYGYNPSLVAHRVHDAMTAVATIVAQTESRPAKIILIGSNGAGVVAAATAAVLKERLAGVVVDTEGFRFASLNNPWDPMFVPGAVKYGDVPGLLKASGALNPVVLGDGGTKGGAEAIVAAVLKMNP